MSCIHGKLKCKKWKNFIEELGSVYLPCETDNENSSTHCPGDVMKLPREEMHTYGFCPNWDRFIIIKCDKCNRKVKAEALESHITLRHGSKSEQNAYFKILAYKAKTSSDLRNCQVKLTPIIRLCDNEDQKHCVNNSDITLNSGYSSSTSPTLPSHPSTPQPFRGSSLSPFPTPTPPLSTEASNKQLVNISGPEMRSPSPDEVLSRHNDHSDMVEDLDIDFIDQIPNEEEMESLQASPLHSIVYKPSSMPISRTEQFKTIHKPETKPIISIVTSPTLIDSVREADSTTNNVISIPDSDDISNIEIDIISEGQVTDSINTKYNVTLMKPDLGIVGVPGTPSSASPTRSKIVSPSRNPNKATLQQLLDNKTHSVPKLISLPPRQNVFLTKTFKGSPRLESLDSPPSATTLSTHTGTTTHLSNSSSLFSKISPKKPVLLKTSLESKKPSGREREYDPNKHCGVWDEEGKRHCTRSLTCKSHSVYLKRKVFNRSGPFDQLLATHKADKEALNKCVETSNVNNGPVNNHIDRIETESILARRQIPHIPINQQSIRKTWDLKETPKNNSLLKPIMNKNMLIGRNLMSKNIFWDENLDYSTEHPKPLSVCTFGGKRVGGIYTTDRPKFLTRKIMRLAISNVGLSKYQIGTLTGIQGVKRLSGIANVPVTLRQQSMPYLLNVKAGKSTGSGGDVLSMHRLGYNGSRTHYVVQDAFKTDIQDFKGGIKFELGKNMQNVMKDTGTD